MTTFIAVCIVAKFFHVLWQANHRARWRRDSYEIRQRTLTQLRRRQLDDVIDRDEIDRGV